MTFERLFGLHFGVKFKPGTWRESRMQNEEKGCSCYSCIKWTPGAYESIRGIFWIHSWANRITKRISGKKILSSERFQLLLLFAELQNYLERLLIKTLCRCFWHAKMRWYSLSHMHTAPVLHNHISSPPFETISGYSVHQGTPLIGQLQGA